MDVSKEEAAAALAAIQQANQSARSAFRAHHGHLHLWIWGGVWTTMALCAHFRGPTIVRFFPWMSAAGFFTSMLVGFLQSSQVRSPVDRRFFGALAGLLCFAALAPFVLRPAAVTPELSFAYIGLVVSQSYVLAGVWFDTYMAWFGVLVAALILIGLFVFTAHFWLWIAVGVGGAFLLAGFYVRYFWR
jgi:hypothetical protein